MTGRLTGRVAIVTGAAGSNVGVNEDFAEAVVRLALVGPTLVTGRTVGHREVLDGSYRPFTATPMSQV